MQVRAHLAVLWNVLVLVVKRGAWWRAALSRGMVSRALWSKTACVPDAGPLTCPSRSVDNASEGVREIRLMVWPACVLAPVTGVTELVVLACPPTLERRGGRGARIHRAGYRGGAGDHPGDAPVSQARPPWKPPPWWS
jgi:hypothetical protein